MKKRSTQRTHKYTKFQLLDASTKQHIPVLGATEKRRDRFSVSQASNVSPLHLWQHKKRRIVTESTLSLFQSQWRLFRLHFNRLLTNKIRISIIVYVFMRVTVLCTRNFTHDPTFHCMRWCGKTQQENRTETKADGKKGEYNVVCRQWVNNRRSLHFHMIFRRRETKISRKKNQMLTNIFDEYSLYQKIQCFHINCESYHIKVYWLRGWIIKL